MPAALLLLLLACPKVPHGPPSIPLPWAVAELDGRALACRDLDGNMFPAQDCPVGERALAIRAAPLAPGEVVLGAGRVIVRAELLELEQDFGLRPTGHQVEEVDPGWLAARLGPDLGAGDLQVVQALRVDLADGTWTFAAAEAGPAGYPTAGPLAFEAVLAAWGPDGRAHLPWSWASALDEGEADPDAVRRGRVEGLVDLDQDGALEVVVGVSGGDGTEHDLLVPRGGQLVGLLGVPASREAPPPRATAVVVDGAILACRSADGVDLATADCPADARAVGLAPPEPGEVVLPVGGVGRPMGVWVEEVDLEELALDEGQTPLDALRVDLDGAGAVVLFAAEEGQELLLGAVLPDGAVALAWRGEGDEEAAVEGLTDLGLDGVLEVVLRVPVEGGSTLELWAP